MERRVEALEAGFKELRDDMKALRADLHAMRTDLSYVRGKIETTPTTIQLFGLVFAVVVASGLMRYFAP